MIYVKLLVFYLLPRVSRALLLKIEMEEKKKNGSRDVVVRSVVIGNAKLQWPLC